ncbi:MAG: hypothetical protein QME85_02815 [Candidatus Saccharicenans sp.]|nr:hypothetical protein [Candidatus Saccharicenans sp.]
MLKRGVFFLALAILIIPSGYSLLATDWQWVGTLTLSSNVERKDYVDLQTIVYDRANKTVTYRILSIVIDSSLTTKRYARHLTRLESGYKTKILDFQVCDAGDRVLMFTKEGWEDPTWMEPEDLSLLQRAIDMVLEKLEGNQMSNH